MSIINIFDFQVALVCLPPRDVSAESQAGLSSLVSLIFYCWGLSDGESKEGSPSVVPHASFCRGESSGCPA